MNFPKPILITEFLKRYLPKLELTIEGRQDVLVRGLSLLHLPRAGTICFAEDRNVLEVLLNSSCSAIILRADLVKSSQKGLSDRALVVVDNPSKVFQEILRQCFDEEFDWNTRPDFRKKGAVVAIEADISVSARIGNGTVVYPNAFIDAGVVIGSSCVIHAGARILQRSILGNGVYIGPNSVVGARPNWVFWDHGRLKEFMGAGRVVIKNYATIGANSVLERGLVFNTRIGSNSVVGNGAQIGHDSVLDDNVLVAGQAGVAGGCFIGRSTRIYAQSGIAQNLRIAPRTIVNGKSAVMANIVREGRDLIGIPAIDKKQFSRRQTALNRLPRILKEGRGAFGTAGKPHVRLASIISDQLSVPVDLITMDFDLLEAGSADSLDVTNLILAVEQEFEIEIDDEAARKIRTFRSFYKVLVRKLQEQNS